MTREPGKQRNQTLKEIGEAFQQLPVDDSKKRQLDEAVTALQQQK